MMETVEFFKGLNFTVKYQIESTRAHFIAYAIIAKDQYLQASYLKSEGVSVADSTENLEDAEVYLEAIIKFDGTMEASIMPNSADDKGSLYFGGKYDAIAFGKLIEGIYEVAAHKMASWQG